MRYTIEIYGTGHTVIYDNHTQKIVEVKYFRTNHGMEAVCARLNHEHELNVNDTLQRRAGRYTP